jgi:hypothetical protein
VLDSKLIFEKLSRIAVELDKVRLDNKAILKWKARGRAIA